MGLIKGVLLFSYLVSALLSLEAYGSIKSSPEIRLESLDYADPLSTTVNQYLGSLRVTVPTTLKLDNHFRFKFSPFAQSDPANKSVRETFFWDPGEAYVEWKNGYHSFQAGYNVFNWNGTDGYNPVDVVNARILFDPLRSDKKGARSISYRGGVDIIDWQFIFIPLQEKTQMPGETSRWLPRAVYVADTSTTQFLLPTPLQYTYSNDTDIDNSLTNNFGGRVQLHVNGIDTSIQYFEGAATTPAIFPTIGGNIIQVSPITIVQAFPNISLQPEYYRHRLVGLTSTVTLGDTLIRVAGDYDQPLAAAPDVPGWSYNIVAEVERSFSVGSGTLTFVPEYGYAVHQASAGDTVSSLNRLFDNTPMLGIRYAPGETWSVLLSGLYDSNTQDEYFSAQITHNFSDLLKASLSGDYFAGTATSILGNYVRNNRAIADLYFQF